MSFVLNKRIRAALASPRYITSPLAGIDISASGIKAVRLAESMRGLILAEYAEAKIPPGAFTDGEIVDHEAVAAALTMAAEEAHISAAHVALPESKSYLFETTVAGSDKSEWRTGVEQHLDELIPLPPSEVSFDIVEVGRDNKGNALVAGIGFAHRIVEESMLVCEKAGIDVLSLEGEMFASARALLPFGDESTVLIVDLGKSTTKISIVARRVPRFATTINIGGHALTLAVQKYFGVTEADARKVKIDHGIVSSAGNEEYIAAMLSTVSAIRDEIARRLEYWQEHASLLSAHEPVSRAILIGGNASVRGLPEYFENELQIPVLLGDVFTNCVSRDKWIPSIDHTESLAYTTAIGLALRGHQYYGT